jgi:FG-GAP-like repeat
VTGDFNGDGKAGIVFTTANGGTAIWEDFVTTGGGQGQFNQQGNLQDNGRTWHVKATGDFDGDDKDDIVWQNDSGQVSIWLMNGTQIKDGRSIVGTDANGPTWHVAAARDMNADGRADLVFQNDSGAAAVWENFTPASGATATFNTQMNFVPDPNPTGHLDWHVL